MYRARPAYIDQSEYPTLMRKNFRRGRLPPRRQGETIAHPADCERIMPPVKYQRAGAARAANDKAGLDHVESDSAAVGVGGGPEPADHDQGNQHGTNDG